MKGRYAEIRLEVETMDPEITYLSVFIKILSYLSIFLYEGRGPTMLK